MPLNNEIKVSSVQDLLSFLEENGYNKESYDIVECENALQKHFKSLIDMKGSLSLPSTLYPDTVNGRQSLRYFFRGHEDKAYKIRSSVSRLNVDCESELFKFFLTHAPEKMDGLSNLDKLTMMQHYGCGTRLLDITDNPLVALYFASKIVKKDKSKNEVEPDGEFIVFSPLVSTILDWNSIYVKFLSSIPELEKQDRNELVNLVIQELRENRDPILGTFSDESKSKIKEILNKISFSIDEKFDFREVLFPRTLTARTFFPRIRNQHGFFIIDPIKRTESNENVIVAKKMTIPGDKKKDILDELDRLGINEYTLFPDLEHFAKYAQWKVSRSK